MSSSSGFGSGSFGSSALGTMPFFNASSLIDAVLYATGHSSPSSETNKRRALVQFMNNRYQEICMGTHWRWLKAAYDLNLDAPYSTGTIDVTQGDETIAGTLTAWSSTLVKPKDILFAEGQSTVYHVSSLTSSSSLELETKYAEDTDTGLSYTLARNQYELPSSTDHLLSFIVDSSVALVPMGVIDFRRLQAQDPTRTGRPECYALIRRDTDDDSVYVEVYPAPDKRYQCHIDYTVRIMYLEDDEDEYPIIPDRYRAVLYYGMLSEFYSYLRDPSGAQLAQNNYLNFLNQMRNDSQLTDDRLQFMPARNYRRRMPQTGRGRGITNIQDFGREG